MGNGIVLQWLLKSYRGSAGFPRDIGSVALDLPSLLIKLDMTMLVERPNGSSWMTGWGGCLAMTFGGRERITTSSRSSPECTPLDESDEARSGGEVEHSVDVESERGVRASWGTPESARRKQRGVIVDVLICGRIWKGKRALIAHQADRK